MGVIASDASNASDGAVGITGLLGSSVCSAGPLLVSGFVDSVGVSLASESVASCPVLSSVSFSPSSSLVVTGLGSLPFHMVYCPSHCSSLSASLAPGCTISFPFPWVEGDCYDRRVSVTPGDLMSSLSK